MSIKVSGTVKRIGELVENGNFKKRDCIIITEEKYPQIIAVEYVKEKESELDYIEVGEKLEIECNIRGREWHNKDGKIMYFLSLQSWKTTKL